ncbi:hypothetical protein IFO69_13725 [Echinicola sp. CAU 1574]|uniref:DUF4382 domain-containing protein n=1 Tax=Echinicola arenosa TaxID=2774144 RepID=A0ABR9AN85_9BACT|nr:hypothetical protein [Echinicola arenosa]MBD8489812.1 hypothetical protein [Echinicola arenosa]
MSRTRIFRNLLLAFSTTALVVSCSQNDEMQEVQESEVVLSAKVSTNIPSDADDGSLVFKNVTVTDVSISVKDVKMLLRIAENKSKPISIITPNKGPKFVVPLVTDEHILLSRMGSFLAPNGFYTNLTFDLTKATDLPKSSPMYGKSVMIKADWKGIPSMMYMDLEDKIDIKFNAATEITATQEIVLELYMDQLLMGIDPALVQDGDGDGMIIVGPNGEDGNEVVYDMIEANLEDALKLKNGEFK